MIQTNSFSMRRIEFRGGWYFIGFGTSIDRKDALYIQKNGTVLWFGLLG